MKKITALPDRKDEKDCRKFRWSVVVACIIVIGLISFPKLCRHLFTL